MPFLKSILSCVNLKTPTYVKTIQAISTEQQLARGKIYAPFISHWDIIPEREKKDRERQIHGILMDHFVNKQNMVMWGQAKIASLALYISTEYIQGMLWHIQLLLCSLGGRLFLYFS